MRSDRHIELQNMLLRWIENRTFKRVCLTEASILGYAADFIALAGMYDSAHTRYTIQSGLKKKYATRGLRSLYQEYGDIDRWYICVFEVKVTRSDFLNTFGDRATIHARARLKPVGTAHWVVAEKGVCEPEELPDFWGLLVPYGRGLSEKKCPKLQIVPESKIHAVAFDLLWLQMNYRTSYFVQLARMSEAIQRVQAAIIRKKPTGELLRLSNQAVKACRGFV